MAVVRLTAKPAVKKVSRIITIPKTVRTVLRPDPQALKRIKQAVKPRRIQPVKPQKAVIARRPLPRSKQAHANAVREIRTKKKQPTIRYHNKDTSAANKLKLKEIKSSGKGKTLIIVGNGPSISEVNLKDLKRHPSIDIMSINKPDARIWPTDSWLFCDSSQYKRHNHLWTDYSGQIFNTTAIRHQKKNSIQIRNIGGTGFSKDLVRGFHVGRSSVYAAMQVALWLNYDHVYIFGCDMASVVKDGKEVMHFYGDNPDVKPKNRAARFDSEAKFYKTAAGDLPDHARAKFTFCSGYNKFDFVDRFNRLHHIGAVDEILDRLENKEPKTEQVTIE